MRPSFGTPNKLRLLNYDTSKETKSAERHQKSLNDRQRRRQIIAKLAQKRKQYQIGNGIPKHNKPLLISPVHTIDVDNKNEEEKQISPIQCQSNNDDDDNDEEYQEYDDSLYNDGRDEEIKMLKAQNQRLSNKLEHVETELVETQVFLRSERKRNKNLSHQIKLKEDEIDGLSQNIENLEIEIEEKDKKCIECIERLSKFELKFVQQNETLINTQKEYQLLSNKIKQSYSEIKEWQNKYYDIFEKYSSSKSQHKQQIYDLRNQLNLKDLSQTENITKLNQLIKSQNSEIQISKRQNTIFSNAIHSITKIISNSNDNNNDIVSKQLNSMLSNIIDIDDNSNENQNERDISLLLQSLVGVIDKSNRLYSCLKRYENDIAISKDKIIGYEERIENQQEKLEQLQDNFGTLTNEKLKLDNKYNKTTKELQTLYETIFTATDELQTIVFHCNNNKNIGDDIDISQCIKYIKQYTNDQKLNQDQIKNILSHYMLRYENKFLSLTQSVRNRGTQWNEKMSQLQDKLTTLQLHLLHNNGNNNDDSNNDSDMSLDDKSFHINDIQSQFIKQIELIDKLKLEMNNKQKRIDTLIKQSKDIEQVKHDKKIKEIELINKLKLEINNKAEQINNLEKEKNDALNDFQCIAKEWENMESQMDKIYIENEKLSKKLNDINYWINYMLECNDHNEFESICVDDIPQGILHKLHNYMLCILTKTTQVVPDIHNENDTLLLEQLFGNLESTESKQEEEKEKDIINKMEAKLCLESIIHKVELNYVGNEAENIINTYQDRLKTYHNFIQNLQNKMQAITLERDHAWSQYQTLQTEMKKLLNQNDNLQLQISQNQQLFTQNTQELQLKIDELNKFKKEDEMKLDSLRRQLELNENTNMNIHQRLKESTVILQQVVEQRDNLHQEYINVSTKFRQYKESSDTILKRSCQTMVESMNPLMNKLNQYETLKQRLENINAKVRSLAAFMKNKELNEKEEKNNEIEEIKKECDKSALKKLRIHADIHRFQFAKLLQQMKQKYCKHIDTLKTQISTLQVKLNKKGEIESQLISLKKSFNKEIVNYQNVQNQNKEKEKELTDNLQSQISQNQQLQLKIDELNKLLKADEMKLDSLTKELQLYENLKRELHEKEKYSHNIAKQNQINIKKRAETQDKLNEQNKKSKKLHNKAVKLQSELKAIKPQFEQLKKTLIKIENENKDYKLQCDQLKITMMKTQNENKDYKLQFDQLEALNVSLKEAIETKDINHSKMKEIYDVKIKDLKEALTNVENVNNSLNDKSELQQQEIEKYRKQMEVLKKSNLEYAQNLEKTKSKRIYDERQWLENEEDLRNEINVLRQQLQDSVNNLGSLKLDSLENETFVKKLQNEIKGLNEQILFYKECEIKNKNEREMLEKQRTEQRKTQDAKINDIKMILDAKAVRIMRLQEEVENKQSKIRELETELIQLKNEISTTKAMMNEEQYSLKTKNNENNKLQSIINDLSDELKTIKTERSKLFSELETQKNVNVALSLELDSMQKFVDKSDITTTNNSIITKSINDDDLNKYSNISFFDVELENPRQSKSMPNIDKNYHDQDQDDDQNGDRDDDQDDDDDIINHSNSATIYNYGDNTMQSEPNAGYVDIHRRNYSNCNRKHRRLGLPIPTDGIHDTSQSSSPLEQEDNDSV